MRRRGFNFPRRRILAGEDGYVLVWILTPTGLTTPNSTHVWKDEAIWNDTYIWTEEALIQMNPLTKSGTPVIGRDYIWIDYGVIWRDNTIWTEN
jgi:hypothetical protein